MEKELQEVFMDIRRGDIIITKNGNSAYVLGYANNWLKVSSGPMRHSKLHVSKVAVVNGTRVAKFAPGVY